MQKRVGAVVVASMLAGSASAGAELWEEATATTIGTTAGWSNKVELADIDGDGQVDILFANGGGYAAAGAPELNGAFLNQGAGVPFTDASAAIFDTPDLARVTKARDLDGDGHVDLMVGTTYQTRSRLYLGDGDGAFTEVTATHLPDLLASVGDVELGDVDGDGDLDLVLADWGPGSPGQSSGGRTMLWLNDGAGRFTDATAERMPEVLVRWSWDLELSDVDNDFDLDILVSCKACTGSYLFVNDGQGRFTEATGALPQFGNNYELEAMDLDGDGWLDLITLNDGPQLRNHVFRNAGDGTFTDVTAAWWPVVENPGADDNMIAFLDADSDGDADFVIGSLGGADRLLYNDGEGRLTLDATVVTGNTTPGTLGIAVADLDGDHRLDLVQAQGEVALADTVHRAVDLPVDGAAPAIGPVEELTGAAPGTIVVRARVHDRKTPVMAHDLAEIVVRWSFDAGPEQSAPMLWYGGSMWRAPVTAPAPGVLTYRVCATDAAGNQACADEHVVTVEEALADAGPGLDAGTDAGAPGAGGKDDGCGCRSSAPAGLGLLLPPLLLLLRRRRAARPRRHG